MGTESIVIENPYPDESYDEMKDKPILRWVGGCLCRVTYCENPLLHGFQRGGLGNPRDADWLNPVAASLNKGSHTE